MYFDAFGGLMTIVRQFYDGSQLLVSFFLATTELAMLAMATMVMELMGMRIAATRGDRLAEMAKLSPTKLYRIETTKPMVTIPFPERA